MLQKLLSGIMWRIFVFFFIELINLMPSFKNVRCKILVLNHALDLWYGSHLRLGSHLQDWLILSGRPQGWTKVYFRQVQFLDNWIGKKIKSTEIVALSPNHFSCIPTRTHSLKTTCVISSHNFPDTVCKWSLNSDIEYVWICIIAF